MDTITIEDFAKATSGLKVGTIKEVRPHPNAEKLICLTVDVGDGDVRPVVAGIKKHYTAEELVGKQIIVCTNLPPANLRGEESKGMLLAASDAEGLSLVTLDKPRAPGSPIK
jgi:methionyl-tRNA synthetase